MPNIAVSAVTVVALALGLALAPLPAEAGQGAAPAQAGQGAASAQAHKKPTPAPAQAPPVDDGRAQKRTVADLRNIGTAIFSWITDQVTDETDEEGAAPCGEAFAIDKKTGEKTLDLYSIPEISWEDLQKILVPVYIQELPREDGWGNPFEFRLNRESLTCSRVIAIRSAGADGAFDTSIYSVKSFTPSDVHEDLVWADGYFIRWPQATTADQKPLK